MICTDPTARHGTAGPCLLKAIFQNGKQGVKPRTYRRIVDNAYLEL